MRLGQLARKFDIPVQEIINYLEEQTGEKFHPNAKLFDALESKVYEHFDLSLETPIETPQEIAQKEVKHEESITDKIEVESENKITDTPEEEIVSIGGEIGETEESTESIIDNSSEVDELQNENSVPAKDEVIQTDKLLEMLESDETSPDIEKIKLIKAPKKELAGLKVVGKVDLPEPKKKEEKPKEIVTERDLREYRNPKRKRTPLSEEEKEKRRLRAKQKKEEYEARQEKRKKEQENRKAKARKEAHYKQKIDQTKTIKIKQKDKNPSDVSQPTAKKIKPEPKTILGKFWRWMNT